MDLRVLEVGDAGAAAYAGKLFARWGAEVIRVDRRARDPSDEVQPKQSRPSPMVTRQHPRWWVAA